MQHDNNHIKIVITLFNTWQVSKLRQTNFKVTQICSKRHQNNFNMTDLLQIAPNLALKVTKTRYKLYQVNFKVIQIYSKPQKTNYKLTQPRATTTYARWIQIDQDPLQKHQMIIKLAQIHYKLRRISFKVTQIHFQLGQINFRVTTIHSKLS